MAPPEVVPVTFPGRWLGGALGALASFLVGAGSWLVLHLLRDPDPLVAADALDAAPLVAFLGIPIAFVLGRHLFPIAHRDGWRSAAAAAVTFALIAPPLGDLELVAGAGLTPWASLGSANPLSAIAGGILIGGVGLVFSYVALPVTAAVAATWVVLMRLLPAWLPRRLEMPRTIARLGVRHLAYLALAWFLVAWTAWAIVRPSGPDGWS
ncbi:MAG TPA: hypothetical protein VFI34_01245 [Candidatus Limnocylindrales bacterium]|nr:hypothetical protein [Candidatus Limnocylindrales bacterium]